MFGSEGAEAMTGIVPVLFRTGGQPVRKIFSSTEGSMKKQGVRWSGILCAVLLVMNAVPAHSEEQPGETGRVGGIESCPPGQYFDLFDIQCEPLVNGEPSDAPTVACVENCVNISTADGLVNPITFSDCSVNCSEQPDELRADPRSFCTGPSSYWDPFDGTCKLLDEGQPTDPPPFTCIANCTANSMFMSGLVNPVKFAICAAKC